jgi:anti-sigma factor RsiW
MTDHLSSAVLNSLVDGELPTEQLVSVNQHLAVCPACTSDALGQSLLKSSTSKVGQRYTPPQHLQERLARLVSHMDSEPEMPSQPSTILRTKGQFEWLGWFAAAALFLVSISLGLLQRSQLASIRQAAWVTEVSDQHIATLATSLPPQVLSTDRHTVKPWFQGKIPFSFNIPENLPSDTTLDGANLAYLGNEPVAQLLYSIGKHRISVFIRKNAGSVVAKEPLTEHSGFHVKGFSNGDLTFVAVSDVEPSRLSGLLDAIEKAQTATHP